MEYIEFESNKALKVHVEPKDYKSDIEIKKLNLSEGLCLPNSIKIAEIKKCKIIEGFLVTKFKNKPLDCVAHAWNKIDDQYLDYTLILKKHKEEVLSHSYYLVEEYEYQNKRTDTLKKDGTTPTNFEFLTVTLHEFLVFKTNVKAKELEVLGRLRNVEASSKEK